MLYESLKDIKNSVRPLLEGFLASSEAKMPRTKFQKKHHHFWRLTSEFGRLGIDLQTNTIETGLARANPKWPKVGWKIVPAQNECVDFELASFFHKKIIKMSEFLNPETSPPATSYYSLEQQSNALRVTTST